MRTEGAVDLYPYSSHFESDFEAFAADFGDLLKKFKAESGACGLRNAFWRETLSLRKAGRLALMNGQKRVALDPTIISDRELELVRNRIGLPSTRREREHLPHSNQFCALLSRFHDVCKSIGLKSNFGDPQLWCAIVRIMKAERVSAEGPNLFDGLLGFSHGN